MGERVSPVIMWISGMDENKMLLEERVKGKVVPVLN
jgi:hypothetical protein